MSEDRKTRSGNDLTNLMDLEAPPPVKVPEGEVSHDVLPTLETVSDFEPLSDLGMMDHAPEVETRALQPQAVETPELEIPAQDTTMPLAVDEPPPLMPLDAIITDSISTEAQPETITEIFETPVEPSFVPNETLNKIKNYSESKMIEMDAEHIQYPFHFYAEGTFQYFERDKLLRFISENPIGITSSELDLQIQSGRVFFPRVSEYVGIRLIQELRDSGLQFKLYPSDRDSDHFQDHTAPVRITTDTNDSAQSSAKNKDLILPILHTSATERNQYTVFDEIQITQYIKAEMVEAEASEPVQEMLDRMKQNLRIKAHLKGAHAMGTPDIKLIALRLPSQYQIIMRAELLKKKTASDMINP